MTTVVPPRAYEALLKAALQIEEDETYRPTAIDHVTATYTYAELLSAYWCVREEDLARRVPHPVRLWAQQILIDTATRHLEQRVVLEGFAAVAQLQPVDAEGLAVDVLLARISWTAETMGSRYPGLLTRNIYRMASFSQVMSHTKYLVGQIEREPHLTAAQRHLGNTLAQDWEGTLPSLLDTIRRIADQSATAQVPL